MIKRLLAVLAVCALTFGVAACGGDDHDHRTLEADVAGLIGDVESVRSQVNSLLDACAAEQADVEQRLADQKAALDSAADDAVTDDITDGIERDRERSVCGQSVDDNDTFAGFGDASEEE